MLNAPSRVPPRPSTNPKVKRRSILFVASECAGFIKAGGLGDVVAALPKALAAMGHDVRIVLPRYDAISTFGMRRFDEPLGVPLGTREAWCGVYKTTLPGTTVPVYLIDNHDAFGRGYLYDPPGGYADDNIARFALLSRGALQLAKQLHFVPDVIHVHDWPSALVPVYLNTVEAKGPFRDTATVLTIHNLGAQPKFKREWLAKIGIPESEFRPDSLEDFGGINPLKGGLYHATKLVAVSRKYAEEIRTEPGGAGLGSLLRFRGGDLLGIVNGIDDSVWDPSRDTDIPARYSKDDLQGKAICKRELQRELGLEVDENRPLIGIISRLAQQKGTDVVLSAASSILALGAELVILGSGDPGAERYLQHLSRNGQGRFHATVGFHDQLAHRIEAASDLFLMPSRFEPCGLNQLYSQRYGTLPIVRATGGLDDTVDNYVAGKGQGTGFKLWDLTEESLVRTVAWAIDTYRNHKADFRAMQIRAMSKEFSWARPSEQYSDVYDWAIAAKRG